MYFVTERWIKNYYLYLAVKLLAAAFMAAVSTQKMVNVSVNCTPPYSTLQKAVQEEEPSFSVSDGSASLK
jgi:hypothetical protein